MSSTVRRDFRSVPHRDAAATWLAIVDLLTAGGGDADKRRELLAVTGVVSSAIADQCLLKSPFVVTCDGPRTRIYCLYDDDALDSSAGNEAKLGFDAVKGNWEVSIPVNEEDLSWVRNALKQHSSRIVARDASTGFETEKSASTHGTAAKNSPLELDIEGFMKS